MKQQSIFESDDDFNYKQTKKRKSIMKNKKSRKKLKKNKN